MSSIRNHRIRSHKTYRGRMMAARRFLNGSLPWEVKQGLRAAAMAGLKPVQSNPVEEDTAVED